MALREGGLTEAEQYLVGILGLLTCGQAQWTPVLLFLPTAYVFETFEDLKDIRENWRSLSTRLVEPFPDMIVLLEPHDGIRVANHQAASRQGVIDRDGMVGVSLLHVVGEAQRQ